MKEKRTQKKYGWHILNNARSLRDGRIVEDGELVHARRLYFSTQYSKSIWKKCSRTLPRGCCFGMHACTYLENAIDFGINLHNSDHFWVCRVAVEDKVIMSWDKFVGRKRKILWSVNIPRNDKGSIWHIRDLRRAIKKAYKKKYGKELKMKIAGIRD